MSTATIELPEGVELVHFNTEPPKENHEKQHEDCTDFLLVGSTGLAHHKGWNNSGVRVKLKAGYACRFDHEAGEYRAVPHFGPQGKTISITVYDELQAKRLAQTVAGFTASEKHDGESK